MTTAMLPAGKLCRIGAALALGVGLGVSLESSYASEAVLTPHRVAELRSVSEVALSPDGTMVAYVLRVPREPMEEEDGPAWAELHVVTAEGASRPFVTGKVKVGMISWTPDGRGISFLSGRESDEHKALYVIPMDGGEGRRILSHEEEIKGYSWSPDGERVAFLAEEPIPEALRELEEKGFDQKIYEEEKRWVRVWVAEPGAEDEPPRMLELPGSATELHWSPTGASLAVALAPTALIDDYYMRRKLHVVDAEEGEVLARIENPGKLGQVSWSPDGRYLALVSAVDIHDPRAGHLMIVPAGGGELRDLLPDYQGHIRRIGWQGQETLMFLGHEGVWTTLSEIRRDGRGRKAIIEDGGPVLARLSLSSDGRAAAFIGESPDHPSEVYFMRHGDRGPRRLTDGNPWLADMRLAPQEVVEFNARDGLRLEGILIRPLDEEEGERYPLILVVHGGPESHYLNGWLTSYSNPGQVGAARGFAVFYPNYRASTGRGVAFSRLDQGEPAGEEFDDLVDAVDHLVAAGLAARDRVGVTGGSYGGYATGWCTTYYSDRFAAGVMRYGLSDLVSKYGTTDIPWEMYYVHYLKHVWEDWELFQDRSPVYHMDKARTPLLIVHGEDDERVHPSQSLEMYRYLKLRGQAPVRLVFYPDEGHGFRRAAHRLDFNLRMMRWLEHYLKGPGGDPPPYEIDYSSP